MNMNFQRPPGLELKSVDFQTTETALNKPGTKKNWSKYAFWSFMVLGAVYVLTNSSARTLLILGGVVVALVALATFVCIRAQNETPYW